MNAESEVKWSEVYSPLGQRDATYVFVALVFKP